MTPKISEPVEVEMPFVDKGEEAGYCYAGIYGGTDMAAMADRQTRVERYSERENYRECVPCDRCTYAIELRKFMKSGEEKLAGMICTIMERETTKFHTCNKALRNRTDRKKIVYDLTNAPIGFRVGIGTKAELGHASARSERGAEVEKPSVGYRGGSNYYQRADKDRGATGSGKMPKVLMN